MIVTTKDDTVKLSGALVRNQWLTIKAAANLLLQEHPEGILIDGGDLTSVTDEGARTFLDAMKDIQAAGARMVVCNLPESVMDVLRTVPGVRSQLPLAISVADARASLQSDSCGTASIPDGSVIVPAIKGLDAATAVRIAASAARERGLALGIVAYISVSRHLALGTPAPEEEARALELVASVTREARRYGMGCASHLERVRGENEGLLATLSVHRAALVVVALSAQGMREDASLELVDLLLRKAPCDVIVARAKATDETRNGSANGGGKAG